MTTPVSHASSSSGANPTNLPRVEASSSLAGRRQSIGPSPRPPPGHRAAGDHVPTTLPSSHDALLLRALDDVNFTAEDNRCGGHLVAPPGSLSCAASRLDDEGDPPALSSLSIAPTRLGHGGKNGFSVYFVYLFGSVPAALKICQPGFAELSFCSAVQQRLRHMRHHHQLPPPEGGTSTAAMDDGLFGTAPRVTGDPWRQPEAMRRWDCHLALPLCMVRVDSMTSELQTAVLRPVAARLPSFSDSVGGDGNAITASPNAAGNSKTLPTGYIGVVMVPRWTSLARLLAVGPPPSRIGPHHRAASSTSTSVSTDLDAVSPLTSTTPSSPTSDLAPDVRSPVPHLLDHTGAAAPNRGGFIVRESQGPFYSLANRRRIKSDLVVAAITVQIACGLLVLRSYAHSVPVVHSATKLPTTREYKGFSHLDLRLDNVLVDQDGGVSVCDFELIAHVTGKGTLVHRGMPKGGTSLPNSARILPRCYHPPEGPLATSSDRGDFWMLGLLTLELITGVVPAINGDEALNDISSGKQLTVDPTEGIGYEDLNAHFAKKLSARRSAAANNALESSAPLQTVGDAGERGDRRPNQSPVATPSSALLFNATDWVDALMLRCLQNDPTKRWSDAQLYHHVVVCLKAFAGSDATGSEECDDRATASSVAIVPRSDKAREQVRQWMDVDLELSTESPTSYPLMTE